MITQKELKRLLHYNPASGIFTWRVAKAARVSIGDVAGGVGSRGYCCIRINGKIYLAHRLAWLYVYGFFPENQIDHINRRKDDNRISNLREVSRQCNMRNSGNRCDNTSGIKGVVWDKRDEKWRARIKVNKKYEFLGCYADLDDAVCARLAGEQCLNWSGCDSSSPAFQYVQENITGVAT